MRSRLGSRFDILPDFLPPLPAIPPSSFGFFASCSHCDLSIYLDGCDSCPASRLQSLWLNLSRSVGETSSPHEKALANDRTSHREHVSAPSRIDARSRNEETSHLLGFGACKKRTRQLHERKNWPPSKPSGAFMLTRRTTDFPTSLVATISKHPRIRALIKREPAPLVSGTTTGSSGSCAWR